MSAKTRRRDPRGRRATVAPPGFLNIGEAAQRRGVKYGQVYYAIQRGNLPYREGLGGPIVAIEDVDAWKPGNQKKSKHKFHIYHLKVAADQSEAWRRASGKPGQRSVTSWLRRLANVASGYYDLDDIPDW